MPSQTNLKVIANGHVIEVYEYELPVWHGYEGQGGRKSQDEPKSDREDENRRLTCRRARDVIRRICLANFDDHSKFVTLTFREQTADVKKANIDFKRFIQRMRRRYANFKYVAVIEFHEKGGIHYHMMSDLPYIPKKQLEGIWSHGFVRINDITNVDNVGAYMVKYMLKDITDERLRGHKAYLTSRGLNKPITLRGIEAQEVLDLYRLEDKKKVFTNSYISEHHGNINYSEYNLKREE